MDASPSAISAALSTAASQISSNFRECSYFSVSKKMVSSSVLRVDISFLVDNVNQLSLIQVFDATLTGITLLVAYQRFHGLIFILMQQS